MNIDTLLAIIGKADKLEKAYDSGFILPNRYGVTWLGMALSVPHLKLAQKIIDETGNSFINDRDNKNPFYYTVLKGEEEFILSNLRKCEQKQIEECYENAINYVFNKREYWLLERLYNMNINLDSYSIFSKIISGLMNVTWCHIIDKIIDNEKYDSQYVDEKGNTLLISACISKNVIIASKLIEKGNYKPEHVNNKGETALIWACYNKLPVIAMKIINGGNFNGEQKDEIGNTALFYAKQLRLENIVAKLSESDKDKDQQNNLKLDNNIENQQIIFQNKTSIVSIFDKLWKNKNNDENKPLLISKTKN